MQLRRRAASPKQIQAAMAMYAASAAVRTARVWQLQWLTREPTTARYPNPVCLARVLSEHHAAVAAEPLGD